jgi:tetratricopeptide (TPR) repeat protein
MLKTLALPVRFILANLCISLIAMPCFADDSAHEAAFQKGLAAYQNKQFEEARASFQSLLDQGVVTAEVLHNLALSNYQLNQKPFALALWRKALSLEPGYRAARNGRDFAENELNQRGFERDQVMQFLRDTLEFISFYEAAWLIALMIGVSGFLWLRYFGERKTAFEDELPLPPFPTSAVVLTVLLFIWIGFTGLKARQTFRTRATIVAGNVSARSLPAEEGVALFELRGGSEVLIRRRNKDWSQVLNSEGSSGWIKDSDLFITSGR